MAHLRADALEQRQIFDITNPGAILTSRLGDITSGFGDFTSRLGAGASSIFSPILPPLTSDTLSASTSASLSASTSSSSTESLSTSTTSSEPTPLLTSSSPTRTVTSTVNVSASSVNAAPSAPAPKGFLQNKPLAGFVFGLIGLIAVIAIFTLATFVIRRRRNKRTLQDAISFEPTVPHGYGDDMERALTEKTRRSTGSDGYGSGPPSHNSHGGDYSAYSSNQTYYERSAATTQPYSYATYALPSQLARQNYEGAHQQILPANPATANTSYNGLMFQPANGRQVPFAGPLPDTFGDSRPALKVANMY